MLAKDLEQQLRRIGLLFIVGLVFQLRVNGRSLLLPVVAGLMAWLLRDLLPLAQSSKAKQALQSTIVTACVVAAVGIIGFIPAVEPGGTAVVVAVLFLSGLWTYTGFWLIWGRAVGWTDAQKYLQRARVWILVDLVLVVLAVAALLALGERGTKGIDGADANNLIFGRHVQGTAPLFVFLAISMAWIVVAIAMQLASKQIRTALRAQPESVVPTA